MKIIRFKSLPFLPTSHDDKQNPGSFKKVFFTFKAFPKKGRLQMINWSLLPQGKSFNSHLHEDMDEVFIILTGKARIKVDREVAILKKGDTVFIPMGKIHQMKNISKVKVNYLAIGVSLGQNGRTIVKKVEN